MLEYDNRFSVSSNRKSKILYGDQMTTWNELVKRLKDESKCEYYLNIGNMRLPSSVAGLLLELAERLEKLEAQMQTRIEQEAKAADIMKDTVSAIKETATEPQPVGFNREAYLEQAQAAEQQQQCGLQYNQLTKQEQAVIEAMRSGK
jgi:hypothetical protein